MPDTSDTMKCLLVKRLGDHPKVVYRSPPEAAEGGVRVRIAAGALNFADLLMIDGRYQRTPEPPFVLGLESAGYAAGPGPFPDGTPLAVFSGGGGLASEGVFDASRAVVLPDGLDPVAAAAVPVAYGTSEMALSRAALAPGETLLVTGAGGGVGLTAVAIGRLLGARVIAAARGAAHLEAAEAAGAAHLIDTDREDLREAVIALGRADVVYDTVGGAVFEAAFRAINPGARLLLIGFASGDLPDLRPNHMLVKNATVIGLDWAATLDYAPEAWRAGLTRVFGWIAEGRLAPPDPLVLPLEEAPRALAMLRDRTATGKIVLTP